MENSKIKKKFEDTEELIIGIASMMLGYVQSLLVCGDNHILCYFTLVLPLLFPHYCRFYSECDNVLIMLLSVLQKER